MGSVFGFPCLYTTLIAVACTQFQKMNLALLNIGKEHITIHHGQEDEQVHTIARCDLKALLNSCIQHHQEITE